MVLESQLPHKTVNLLYSKLMVDPRVRSRSATRSGSPPSPDPVFVNICIFLKKNNTKLLVFCGTNT